jgi:serine/threonine protein kinase
MNPSESPKCPKCGTALPKDAPQGLCPRCLVSMNLRTDTLTEEEAAALRRPLSPEQLTPHFPQLEILECLGRGGMGVVYKARQKSLNRLVALKLLAPERVQDAKFAERFSREAQALAALNHPHIVTVHDFGAVDAMLPPESDAPGNAPAAQSRIYFLLMEFVDGVNLRVAMKAGRLAPEQALAIVPPVCEALQYAHEHGIVHRDIKPENLLLDKEGRVKIADFGVAKMLGMEAPAAGAAESQPAGTPQYMAPEQRGDSRRVDHRADIYSLGVVLYEMLTGELPAGKLQPPSRKVTIDVRLDEIVLRALEEQPELRYQTAGDFRTQLETVTHSSPLERNSPTETAPWLRLAPAFVFGAFYIALLCFVAQSSALLPERPATHFNSNGNANGWMHRSTSLFFTAALPLLMAAFFWLVSRAAIRFPGLVNIPRRDYWLAPERRAETSALLFRWLLWLACGMTAFFGAFHALVIQANQLNPPRLPSGPLLVLVIAFLLALMIWIVTLIMRLAEAGHHTETKRKPTGRLWHGWDAWIISLCLVVFGALWLERLQRAIHQSDRPFAPNETLNVMLGSALATVILIVGATSLWMLARHLKASSSVAVSGKRFLGRCIVPFLAVALLIRTFICQPFVVSSDSAAPEIPAGSHILVWKLSGSFAPGDVIAYAHEGKTYVGRVLGGAGARLTVNRNGEPDVIIPPLRVVGRVISVYWRATPSPLGNSPASASPQPTAAVIPDADAFARLSQEGWRLWQAGRLAEAVVKFSDAVKLVPGDANAWNGLGWASFNSGKTAEGEKAFQKVISLEPNHAGGLNGLGQIYLSRREYGKAEPLLLKAAQQGASASWFGLARLYLIQGKFAEAGKWAQMLVDSGQGDAIAVKMLEAAKNRNLNEELRQTIEPPAPANSKSPMKAEPATPKPARATAPAPAPE